MDGVQKNTIAFPASEFASVGLTSIRFILSYDLVIECYSNLC